jgi:acetoin utilization protein AcuB
MQAANLISEIVPALKKTDTVAFALQLMTDFKVSHLALVNEQNQFINLLSEDYLLELDESSLLSDTYIGQAIPFVESENHAFEAIRSMREHHLSAIPVCKNQYYVGLITQTNIVDFIASTGFINSEGAIIVLNIQSIDYSLGDISRIVESNNARIINMYVTSSPIDENLELSLKINTHNTASIIADLMRYGYEIKGLFSKTSDNDKLNDNYQLLMKYLSI